MLLRLWLVRLLIFKLEVRTLREVSEIVIEAGRTEKNYWRDLWKYRELFYFLAWRDILVRYKQTVIGVAWALIRPLATMIVFTFVFGKLAKLPSDGVPYPILVFAAILPWQFFASAFSEAGNSLVGNAGMLSKIYFPRLIIPTSAVITSFIDFLVAGIIMIALMMWYQYIPTIRILALPIFIFLAFLAALGCGIWVATLNVKYRDFGYTIPFLLMLGLYLSPVGFSSKVIPDDWRLLYSLNPLVSIIDGFRWAIVGGDAQIYFPGLVVSTLVVTLVLGTGILYFRRTERTFADTV